MYKSELDPFCPQGQIKKFNDEKKMKAKILAERDKRTDQWMAGALEAKLKDMPVKENINFREKAALSAGFDKNQNAMAEVEILQKVIVRENLLSELHKLLKNRNEVSAYLNEVSELVKALRFQTVDIIEDIASWKHVQPVERPFLFRGLNYLIKIKCDLDFLDLHEEIVERFCFEFKSNPLGYRGGGAVDDQIARGKAVRAYTDASSDGSFFVDGIEVTRLRNAEKIINAEIQRVAKEKESAKKMTDSEKFINDLLRKSSSDVQLTNLDTSNSADSFYAFGKDGKVEKITHSQSAAALNIGGAGNETTASSEERPKTPKKSSKKQIFDAHK